MSAASIFYLIIAVCIAAPFITFLGLLYSKRNRALWWIALAVVGLISFFVLGMLTHAVSWS